MRISACRVVWLGLSEFGEVEFARFGGGMEVVDGLDCGCERSEGFGDGCEEEEGGEGEAEECRLECHGERWWIELVEAL